MWLNIIRFQHIEHTRVFQAIQIPSKRHGCFIVFNFSGRTERRCTFALILLQHALRKTHKTLSRKWYDLEVMFGMCAEKTGELFRELCEFAADKNKHLTVPLRSEAIRKGQRIIHRK